MDLFYTQTLDTEGPTFLARRKIQNLLDLARAGSNPGTVIQTIFPLWVSYMHKLYTEGPTFLTSTNIHIKAC